MKSAVTYSGDAGLVRLSCVTRCDVLGSGGLRERTRITSLSASMAGMSRSPCLRSQYMIECGHRVLEFCPDCQGVECDDCNRYWWDKLYHSIGGRPTPRGFISTGSGRGVAGCKHVAWPDIELREELAKLRGRYDGERPANSPERVL